VAGRCQYSLARAVVAVVVAVIVAVVVAIVVAVVVIAALPGEARALSLDRHELGALHTELRFVLRPIQFIRDVILIRRRRNTQFDFGFN